jgi:hypothetical protein
MDEYILAGLALDESVAFAGVEPLDCSLFFHCYYLAVSYLCFSYQPARLAGRGAGPRLPLARTNKRLQDLRLAAPLNESKGITRATNASEFYQKRAFVVHMDRINDQGGFYTDQAQLSFLFSVF